MEFKLRDGRTIPVEMHKTKVVQTINLLSPDKRLASIREGGFQHLPS